MTKIITKGKVSRRSENCQHRFDYHITDKTMRCDMCGLVVPQVVTVDNGRNPLLDEFFAQTVIPQFPNIPDLTIQWTRATRRMLFPGPGNRRTLLSGQIGGTGNGRACTYKDGVA